MITAKARGFLQRNLCKCPSHVKSSSYITYDRPILDYACTVWSPYHQHNISKIEMVQRRAARFVTNNYEWNSSVTDMLQHLQWEQLQHRQDNFRAIIMYKIIYNLVDINLSESHLQLTNIEVTPFNSCNYKQTLTVINIHSFHTYALRVSCKKYSVKIRGEHGARIMPVYGLPCDLPTLDVIAWLYWHASKLHLCVHA